MEILRLPFGNGEQTAPVRHEVRAALERWAGDRAGDWVEDVILVVSELVQNVSQHTTSDGELVLGVADGEVVVEVADRDPAAPQPQPPDGERIGGRGLLLVAGMSHRWGVRPAGHESPAGPGKIVWARIPVPQVTPATV